MNQFGTARVNFDIDDKWTLKNTSFDLLFPLYENELGLFFVQNSLHRSDDRSQNNIGFGYRVFTEHDEMLGINAFYDYDISHKNKRMGLGGEFWNNYLRFGLNGYLGVSSWKNSQNVTDYLERAASGFDLSIDSWLPSYPQIGGQIKYEQYFGDEIALFENEDFQKNPYGITVGVNYTPVILLKIGANLKQGKDKIVKTSLDLYVVYKIGASLDKQISSSEVKESRYVKNSRYHFVERNNNIVLQYKVSSEKVDVSAEHSTIELDYSTYSTNSTVLVTVKIKDAQGNIISGQSHLLTDDALSLPNIAAKNGVTTFTDKGNGIYTREYVASIVAENNKATLKFNGKTSQSFAYEITEMNQVINNSTITLDKSSYVANSTVLVTITMKDSQGNLISGQSSLLTDSALSLPNIITKSGVTSFTDKGNGVYTREYTANVISQNNKATVTLNGTKSPAFVYTITSNASGIIDGVHTILGFSEGLPVQTANWPTQSRLTNFTIFVTLYDSQGQPAFVDASKLKNYLHLANLSYISCKQKHDNVYSCEYQAFGVGNNSLGVFIANGSRSNEIRYHIIPNFWEM